MLFWPKFSHFKSDNDGEKKVGLISNNQIGFIACHQELYGSMPILAISQPFHVLIFMLVF